MRTELNVKLLQHLAQRKRDEGFTLLELLVVIIIIGTLSVIAVPSYLRQAAKARASEGRANTGALNRAQQVTYLEKLTFTDNINELGLGISNTINYNYLVNSSDLSNKVANLATAQNSDLKSYVGGVFKSINDTTQAILCEANDAGIIKLNNPPNAYNCADGSERMR